MINYIKTPKVGNRIKQWYSGSDTIGMSTILKVSPYTGLYKNLFRWNLVVSCKNTSSGTLKVCM